MLIYHGSQFIIEQPMFGEGRLNNDYGQGFYCTEDFSLACEWSVDRNRDGYVNSYELDDTGLRILNLNDPEFCLLEWLAVLLTYREVELYYPLQKEAKRYILENFPVDISQYDLIKGYRADDSYFTFARDFLNGTISYRQLYDAMHLGKLGEQIVLKSRKAFDAIEFCGSVKVSAEEWYVRKQQRDFVARKKYADMDIRKYIKAGIYMIQILDEEMKKDDLRLR